MRSTPPTWLSRLPSQDGFVQISPPRPFAHEESAYDAQYASDPGNLTVGHGVCSLVQRFEGDTKHPALEVGCGTGLVSLGLLQRSPFPLTILTDPSPAFLRITRRKIADAGVDDRRAVYALLMGEELDRLPERALSLIVLRSTLHHIVDVDRFLAHAARALVPGGLLIMQEPCMEGYVLMGAMVQFLPTLARQANRPLTAEQERLVDHFKETMVFYARRDVDKSHAEDKHLFRVDELMTSVARSGGRMTFLANTTLEQYAPDASAEATPHRFAKFLREYVEFCMSWPADLLARFDELLTPYCDTIEQASAGGSGPYLHGVMVARKLA